MTRHATELEREYAKRLVERLLRDTFETDSDECRAALNVAIKALREHYVAGNAWGRALEAYARAQGITK